MPPGTVMTSLKRTSEELATSLDTESPDMREVLGLENFETSGNPYEDTLDEEASAKTAERKRKLNAYRLRRARARRAAVKAGDTVDNWKKYVQQGPPPPRQSAKGRTQLRHHLDETIRIGLARRAGIT